MITWIILILLSIYVLSMWQRFIPDSYIPHRSVNCFIEIPPGPQRLFGVAKHEILDELDEIDSFDKGTYSFIIKGYVCRIVTLRDSDRIDSSLILFGNNDFDWSSRSYLVCDSEIYFPEPGSILVNEAPKVYHGEPICVIVGDVK